MRGILYPKVIRNNDKPRIIGAFDDNKKET
jgi:hypothetical protein